MKVTKKIPKGIMVVFLVFGFMGAMVSMAFGADADQEITRIPTPVPIFNDLNLNHFKVYSVKVEQFREFDVKLRDQFSRETTGARVVSVDYFANPVSKNCVYIPRPDAHLTWYRIKENVRQLKRKILLKNQFGEQTLIIGEARYLIVPTQKIEPGSCMPVRFNHFKCYRVLEGDYKERKVQLTDQFSRKPIKTVVLRPLYFCTPVQKNNERIAHKAYHLTVYSIKSTAQEGSRPRSINIKNQFGKSQLHMGNSAMLCVPTNKLRFDVLR